MYHICVHLCIELSKYTVKVAPLFGWSTDVLTLYGGAPAYAVVFGVVHSLERVVTVLVYRCSIV